MLWRSRDERFPAMGKCLEWDLSRLLLHRQVNIIENISNKNIVFITEDQLFYLQSRGIEFEEAVSMMVSGFCRDVFNQLPMEFAAEADKLLALKLEGSVG